MPNEATSTSAQSSNQRPRLAITPMLLDDIPAIMELEARCFESPWSADIYRRELITSSFSFYHVVRPAVVSTDGDLPPILAYGGCWVMGDECHLMTIATHPDWRRRRMSEWLLLDLLATARGRAAAQCTLEVRSGNDAAIALYEKLGFEQVGVRRNYYPASARRRREDALIMTLFGLDMGTVWRPLNVRKSAVEAQLLVG
jgi:ribosomal-protein-alanine N-acetyltransferase